MYYAYYKPLAKVVMADFKSVASASSATRAEFSKGEKLKEILLQRPGLFAVLLCASLLSFINLFFVLSVFFPEEADRIACQVSG